MAKSKLKRFIAWLDYHLFSKRITNVFKIVLTKFVDQDGWRINWIKDGAYLFNDLEKLGVFCCWPNNWSTSGNFKLYLIFHDEFSEIRTAPFHQFEEEITSYLWVWLPRLSELGPTSYDVSYLLSRKIFRWKICRVGRGNDTRFTLDLHRDELIQSILEQVKFDVKINGTLLMNVCQDSN